MAPSVAGVSPPTLAPITPVLPLELPKSTLQVSTTGTTDAVDPLLTRKQGGALYPTKIWKLSYVPHQPVEGRIIPIRKNIPDGTFLGESPRRIAVETPKTNRIRDSVKDPVTERVSVPFTTELPLTTTHFPLHRARTSSQPPVDTRQSVRRPDVFPTSTAAMDSELETSSLGILSATRPPEMFSTEHLIPDSLLPISASESNMDSTTEAFSLVDAMGLTTSAFPITSTSTSLTTSSPEFSLTSSSVDDHLELTTRPPETTTSVPTKFKFYIPYRYRCGRLIEARLCISRVDRVCILAKRTIPLFNFLMVRNYTLGDFSDYPGDVKLFHQRCQKFTLYSAL